MTTEEELLVTGRGGGDNRCEVKWEERAPNVGGVDGSTKSNCDLSPCGDLCCLYGTDIFNGYEMKEDDVMKDERRFTKE